MKRRNIEAASREPRVGVATLHRWKAEYGGASADVVNQSKEWKTGNDPVRTLVADNELEIAIWRDVGSEEWQAPHGEERPWSMCRRR